MKLAVQQISLPDRYSVPPEAEEARNSLALMAQGITVITSAGDNEMARMVSVAIRHHLKQVEAARVELTRPLLDGLALLMALKKDHVAPLEVELDRLERLATVYLVAEQARVDEEMKARLELAGEAKTDEDFAIISNEPLPSMEKARGQTMRQILRWEVTDLMALVKDRPDLCKIEPKASAIQATCVPEMPNLPAGLKLWWENKASFTTR